MSIKSIALSITAAFVLVSAQFAQDCRVYFPDRVGSQREIKTYDAKGKLTGSNLQEIIARTPGINSMSIKVKTTAYDADSKEITSGEFEVGCEQGVFKIDMSDYLSQMLQAYQSMEVEMTGDNLAFPSGMKPGDVLPDASMNIIVRSNGMQIMNMQVSITGRTVAGKETIKTEAGSFESFKITSNMVSKTKVITISSSAVEWISEGAGIVRSENYNKKGKLTSYMELSRFVK